MNSLVRHPRPTARDILGRFCRPPRIRKADLWLTVLPALCWLAALQLRPLVIHTRCMANPSPCTPASVLAIDRPGIGNESGAADGFSYVTQNTSGILAVAIPVLYNASLAIGGAVSPGAAAAAIGTDLVILGQTIGVNGTLTETA